MIPKIIHYCWFGDKEMPKLAKKCLKSWEKKCPDYEIICWNEKNFDINECPLYVRQAYENKKWAFVTDYVRLKVIYAKGGIYLDTDVEVLKNLDKFLEYDAFFGFESQEYVNTGLGFGAIPKNEIVHEILEKYENIPFVKENGELDTIPCPIRNTEVLVKNGMIQNNSYQILRDNVAILSKEYFCPIDTVTNVKNITKNTYTIHWYSGSWLPLDKKIKTKLYAVLVKLFGVEIIRKFMNKNKN